MPKFHDPSSDSNLATTSKRSRGIENTITKSADTNIKENMVKMENEEST